MSIRKRLAEKALRKQLTHRSGKALVLCFDDAKTIGVIFSYPQDGKEQVTRLMNLPPLKGRKIRVLGYKPYLPAKDELIDDQTFTIREVNRKFMPTAGAVEAFLEQEYDIILDLSLEDHLPLLWVLTMSKAKLKVSLHSDLKESMADLLIRMEGVEEPGILFSQMIHYLEQFNHKTK